MEIEPGTVWETLKQWSNHEFRKSQAKGMAHFYNLGWIRIFQSAKSNVPYNLWSKMIYRFLVFFIVFACPCFYLENVSQHHYWQLWHDFRYYQPQDDVFHRVLMKALSSPGGTELEASTALIEWRPHHIHSQGIPHQGLLELPMLSAPDSIHPDLTWPPRT